MQFVLQRKYKHLTKEDWSRSRADQQHMSNIQGGFRTPEACIPSQVRQPGELGQKA